jgi:hypothetical protein
VEQDNKSTRRGDATLKIAAAVEARSAFHRKLHCRDVRFGSLADMCGAERHVRFAPNSDRESGHRPAGQPSRSNHQAMSALPPKVDVCSVLAHVR